MTEDFLLTQLPSSSIVIMGKMMKFTIVFGLLLAAGALATWRAIRSFVESDTASALESLRQRALGLQEDCHYGSSWLSKTLGPRIRPPPPALDFEPMEKTQAEEYLEWVVLFKVLLSERRRRIDRRLMEAVVAELEQCHPDEVDVHEVLQHLIDNYVKYALGIFYDKVVNEVFSRLNDCINYVIGMVPTLDSYMK